MPKPSSRPFAALTQASRKENQKVKTGKIASRDAATAQRKIKS
jgi:hypothetical protein